MGKAVGCCGEDVGDAGVNVLVVTGVTAQLSAHGFVAHDVRQVVPEHEHLRQTEGFYFQGKRQRRRASSQLLCVFSYLCVSTHDLAGLLVEGLAVPLPVDSFELASQAVVFAHEQRVDGGQGDVLVHTDVT